METPWMSQPCFTIRGQGYSRVCIKLTVTLTLWTVTFCQLDTDTATNYLVAQPTLQSSSNLLQTSFTASTTISASKSPAGIFNADLPTTGVNTSDSAILAQSSVFVVPSVSFVSTSAISSSETPTDSFEVRSSFLESSESFSRGITGDTIQSTDFLDSVAVSLRWNPTEEQSNWISSLSLVQTLSVSDLGMDTPSESASAPEQPSLIEPTSTWSMFDHSELSLSESYSVSSTPLLTDFSSVLSSVSLFPTTRSMLDISSVQTTEKSQTLPGETTSALMSSIPSVTSPVPDSSNASCAEKETGCGEEEDDDGRVKIIVGVACGAILLVVLVGVVVGCFLRRRGKMTSGSKVDLSSYWDDSVTLSYINGHIDIPKDSADEMISLDNDSFLNSLDSMSFTNTWTSDTSTSKHTNF